MNTNIKKIFLVIATAVFSAVAWYFFKEFAQQFSLSLAANNWNYLGLSILFMSLAYGSLFALALSLDKRFFIPSAAIPALAMLVFTGVTWQFLVAAALLYGFSLAVINFPARLNQSIQLKYYRSITPFIAGISFVLLAVAGLFVQQGLSNTTKTQSVVNTAINYSWNYIKPLVPQFNNDQTVDQFIVSEFQKQGVEKPTNQMMADARKQLSDQVGTKLTGKEKMSDVGKNLLENKISDILPTQKTSKPSYTKLYLIIATLLIVWPFLKFIISAIIAIVLKGLFKSGVLKEKEIQITAKTLALE